MHMDYVSKLLLYHFIAVSTILLLLVYILCRVNICLANYLVGARQLNHMIISHDL